jgi:heat shock protein HslJ
MRVAGAAVAVIAIAVGCAPTVVSGQNIGGTTWRAVQVAGQQPIPGHEPTLKFEDGRIHGWGGCNGFASDERVAVSGDRLVLPEMLLTTAACANPDGTEHPANEMENLFMRTLYVCDRISLQGRQLVISGPSGALVFERG